MRAATHLLPRSLPFTPLALARPLSRPLLSAITPPGAQRMRSVCEVRCFFPFDAW